MIFESKDILGSEEESFLGEDKDLSAKTCNLCGRQRSVICGISFIAIMFHCSLVLIYSCLFVALVRNSQRHHTALNPIEDLEIFYTPQTYIDFEKSPYAGPPSPSVDKAWHDLLSKMTIRVSTEELRKSNQTSVRLPGGGHMAWLGVYHQLHCVKMLRQWNYRDHYHPNLEPADKTHWDIHADHCLDLLRSAAMCHADTTLTTFGWQDQDKPMLNTRPIQHKCVNWSALMRSVQHRTIDAEEIRALKNPNLVKLHR